MLAFKRSAIHVFEQDLDLAVVVEHVEAFHDVGIVNIAKNLDFSADLKADVLLVVAIDDLESVDLAGRTVEDLVDGAARSGAYAVDLLEVGEAHRVGGGRGGSGGGGCGGGWQREGYR